MHSRFVCLSTLLLSLLLWGCRQPAPEIVLSGPAQGTTYTVKVASAPAGIEPSAVRVAVEDVLARVDREMSGYREDSELARFNASTSTDWFAVAPEVATVVAASLKVSEVSGGALDVTVAPLVNLWGMGPAGPPAQMPSEDDVKAAMARVGYRKLHVREDPPALRKDQAGMAIDLNAIAQGYTSDLIAERLASLGLKDFMVDLGGEVRARGRNSSGEPWRIAVERPVDTEPTPYAIVQLDDMAVTTAGEYRHYFVRDGHRYSHTVDPRTGHTMEHDVAAVVVISSNAMDADAWDTALNVLGSKTGYELAVRRDMAVMFILHEGTGLRALMTPRFKQYVSVEPR
jgi:thiamine biosynthesis lipoprotein